MASLSIRDILKDVDENQLLMKRRLLSLLVAIRNNERVINEEDKSSYYQ